MAVFRKLLVHFDKNFRQFGKINRNFGSFRGPKTWGNAQRTCLFVAGTGIALWGAANWGNITTVYAYKPRKKEDEMMRVVKLTSRERRFIKFASVEFDGQLYMTPQDFLESVVEQEPRPRLKRKVLTEKEVENVKDETPSLKRGTSRMFRTLRDKGIISYTEYLFLLSILTKPQSGFRIAFNMFDTDGNERVDKNEFLVLVEIIARHNSRVMNDSDLDEESRKFLVNVVRNVNKLKMIPRKQLPSQDPVPVVPNKKTDKRSYLGSVMEKIFSHAWKDKRGVKAPDSADGSDDGQVTEEYVDDEQGLQRKHLVDTTLTVHFFGKRGRDELKFEGFQRFMENLQSEVLELEFNEFSKGHDTITETDFAKILLRYTYLDTDEYDMFLDRLLDRVKEEKGITFEEFKGFCQFLNNLEDFAIAMKMYTLADHPISKDEFHRAVKICTGNSLSRHLVHTVFAIFDEDGDGHLSYREFIAIMKDRLHRGFKIAPKNEGFNSWKACVQEELRKN